MTEYSVGIFAILMYSGNIRITPEEVYLKERLV
jgi:hypothetical protein